MKKIMITLLVMCILVTGCITVSAEDAVYPIVGENNVRILGRGEFLGEGIRTFNWPNAGFEFEFSGTKAEVYVDRLIDYAANDYEGSYFNVAVYNGDTLVRVNRIKLIKGWNTIYEKKSGDPERAKIMLVRSSEACRGTLVMSEIRCDAKPTATEPREKLIEFIGDSYTAGFANSPDLSDNTWYCAQNTDNWNSYTGFVARHYNADNNVIAYQGKGICANSNKSTINVMPEQFMYKDIFVDGNAAALNMSSKKEHNFMDYQPQLVTIWLGTNDSATPVDQNTFKTAYAAFVDNVRDKYPNATILNIALKGSTYHNVIAEVVNGEGRGEKEGFYMLSLNTFTTSFLGHPDIAEDERIANQIIEKIDSIPGVWDIKREDTEDTEQLSLRANYNTGEVSSFGTTGKSGDSVSVVVMKPGTVLGENIEKSDVVYISQTEADAVGEYSFDFVADRMEGIYQFYLNTTATDSLKNREFAFMNLIPTLSVTSGGNKVEKMSDLSGERDLKVELGGFDMENGFLGILAVAQYKNDILYDISTEQVDGDTQMYGTEVIINEEIKPETDKIKIFFMNRANYAPVIGSYDI